jgi:hypothetical protein
VVLATTDGGKSWVKQDSHTDADFDVVNFTADGQRGWALGHRHGLGADSRSVTGTVVVGTSDGGKSWVSTYDQTGDLELVHFDADGQHGWAQRAMQADASEAATGTVVAATADGGKTWSAADSYRALRALWLWGVWTAAGLLAIAACLWGRGRRRRETHS